MTIKRLAWTVAAIGLSLYWIASDRLAAAPVRQTTADVEIVIDEAAVEFPTEVTFTLEWVAAVPIVDAVLTYDVVQQSCLESASQVPVAVDGSRLEWTWVMIRSGNPPPGAMLWWEWQLTDAAGNRFTTPRQDITLSDNRFEWETVEDEGIHLHWYRGDEVGSLLLEAAVAGLDQLEEEMGIVLQNEVQIYIYGSSADMRDAVLYIQDWAGGVAFDEYNTILIGVPPNIADDWGRSTVRHELAHLVIGQFGWSCVGGSRPNWLNEGLAVLAEGELQEDFAQALDSAIENNNFEPVRSLNGAFPSDNEVAGIAYAQSYSVVSFMLDDYGQEKMQTLLLVLAEGEGYDEALEAVYGFNVDGLELAWREANGFPLRTIPPTPTPLVAANIPTVNPMGAPENVPTPPAAAEMPSGESAGSPGVCGLGMLPLLLLVSAGFRAGRRRERGK